ncbi:MAG: hypothetical protein JW795_17360 [Chitinivibrionales bacterium]|nr:hypothetical protein [Chitinivibrionales bacterium]
METFSMRHSATNAVNGSKLAITHACPQCGAAVTLSERDTILRCSYCRGDFFICTGDIPLYCFPATGRSDDCFYVPYWRFHGFRLMWRGAMHKHSAVDITVCSRSEKCFPVSLGLAAQLNVLHFAQRLATTARLMPMLSYEDFLRLLDSMAFPSDEIEPVKSSSIRSFGTIKKKFFSFQESAVPQAIPTQQQTPPKQMYLHRQSCLIFYPFYRHASQVIDGLTNTVVGADSLEEGSIQSPSLETFESVCLLPTRCPVCGWAMECGSNSHILQCQTCFRAWRATAGGFQEQTVLQQTTDQAVDAWLPFWLLSMKAEGIDIESFDKFLKYIQASMVHRADTSKDLRYSLWFPAFGLNPETLLKWCRALTIRQMRHPQIAPSNQVPPFHPVTVPLHTAFRSLPAVLSELSGKPLQASVTLSLASCDLVLIPLYRSCQDLVHQETTCAINIAALRDS